MPDLAVLAIEGLFGVLFAVSLWRAVRHRDALAWDVTLVFLPIATLLAVQLAGAIVGPLPPWLRTASSVFVLAQPVFSLKLVADLREIPRWVLPAAVAGFALGAGLLTLATGQPSVLLALAPVAVFVVSEAVAAGYLAAEARRRSGSAKMRLAVAAIATAALALAIFVAGATAAAGAAATVSGRLVQVIALLAAIGYGVAFLPPRWLRATFQARETFGYYERIQASLPSAEPAELWGELARAAQQLTGAASVVLAIDGPTLRVVAEQGVALPGAVVYPAERLGAAIAGHGADAVTQDLVARTGQPFATAVPINRDRDAVGIVYLLRRHGTLFDADDAAVVASLATRSADLVQRRQALAEQERLGERLALTVGALQAASAAKSDFLASMSHELRTPLNAIIGFSDLMAADASAVDTVTVPREWVEHIRNGGNHLVELINDVLDLSKVEAGRLDLTKVPVELGRAVAESVAGLRPLANRKSQTIEVSIDPLVIAADAGRLRQILYNLLSNAIKYTDDGGSISVSAVRNNAEVHLAVVDTGVGIAPQDQEHVFEEFRQVGHPSGHIGGTGLGLALTKRLVEAHGGRLELRSILGAGSTFTVILPIGSPLPEPLPDGVDRAPGRRHGARILIIEDDPSSVRLLQAYLADGGYEVTVAPDGETGLALARSDPPAAILLDVLLPRIDGWEVLRRLKADPIVRDVPVIIVTVVDERNVGLALGAVDYFLKPIERDALITRLDRHTFTTKVKTQSITILAIDDDPAALAMIDASLSPLGFAVHGAPSGTEGLALAGRVRPDLIICDLLMPGVDGFEVVTRLQADGATAAIPILILTAHELTESEKAQLNGRVLGVVEKGDLAAQGLRDWLARVVPDMVGIAGR